MEAINASFCKDIHLMHLIRLLVFFASYHSFWFYAAHIAERDNNLADSLSTNNIPFFISQAQPSAIPPSLVTLVAQNLTWTSTSWMVLFEDILQQL